MIVLLAVFALPLAPEAVALLAAAGTAVIAAASNPKLHEAVGALASATVKGVQSGFQTLAQAFSTPAGGDPNDFDRKKKPQSKKACQEGGSGAPKEGEPTTLKPGPYAKESIPADGPSRAFTEAQRDAINKIGQRDGCHTCGAREAGTKSGNFIPDHQPPNALNPEGNPQRLYAHCQRCSRRQGGEIRAKLDP